MTAATMPSCASAGGRDRGSGREGQLLVCPSAKAAVAIRTANPPRDATRVRGPGRMRAPDVEARIPKDVPIHIISGDQDPVGDNTKGVMARIDRYHALGLTKVTYKFYPQARHDLRNETNRDEVQNDLLAWLDGL